MNGRDATAYTGTAMDSPAGWVGFGLVVGGLTFLALDVLAASGVLGIFGLGALIAGAILAWDDTPAEFEGWAVGAVIIVAVALLASLAISVARVRRISARAEATSVVGKFAEARTQLSPDGTVLLQGQLWPAHVASGSAAPGDRVRVVSAQGRTLTVRVEAP